ncbi:uncharacterized protein PG998_013090 [Apiospora kogelbergensis]|uniref:uncharacterized protein n=1 Tax=Apiospora kogelbergensis TaxID=1337665 RepID=UPI00312D23F9
MATDTGCQLVAAPETGEPTFHPFPRLPVELRLKIWEEVIPEIHDRLLFARKPGFIRPEKHKFLSVLQSVSQESREVFLKRFPVGLKITLRTSHDAYWKAYHTKLRVDWYDVGLLYINPKHDVLVVGHPCPDDVLRGAICSDKISMDHVAQPLRRQEHRDAMQNIMELPCPSEEFGKCWEIEKSDICINTNDEDGECNGCGDCHPEYEYEDSYQLSETKWHFGGVKKLIKLTYPLDQEGVLEFYQDVEDLTGSELLQKWHSKCTVTIS